MTHTSITLLLALALAGCDSRPPEGTLPPDAGVREQSPAVASPAPAVEPQPTGWAPVFDKTLELQGITFVLHAQGGTLSITPAGLEVDNQTVVRPIQGEVADAVVADLDADGSPEVYVFLQSGPAARGSLAGYAANKRKSLSEIYLAPLDDDPRHGTGYGGHDTFTVLQDRVSRHFPIMREDGTPSGTRREIDYRLSAGEAGWILVAERVADG
nr:hypothetical protein [uncultured Pseudoxanthomonas sp.]